MAVKVANIEEAYHKTRERLRLLTIDRARRILDNWELTLRPDAEDRALTWQIWSLRQEFIKLEKLYRSSRGEYLFIGCQTDDHKKCARRIRRDGGELVCSCECHEGGK